MAKNRQRELISRKWYEKLIFKLDELNFVFGISRSSAYRAMAAGKLRSIKVGGRRMFKREDIDAFLAGGMA